MAKILLKNDGVFVYADYVGAKAALRLDELVADGIQMIRRQAALDPVAALVSPDSAVFAGGLIYGSKIEVITDDDLSRRLSTLVDLMLPKVQVPEMAQRVANEGKTLSQYKVYAIVDTKQFVEDNRGLPVLLDGSVIGGKIKGYLISADHLADIEAANAAFVGAGNGKFLFQAAIPSIAETITATATSATSFDLAGTVTGPIATLTVGVPYEDASFKALVSDGSTPFAIADVFSLDVALKSSL